MIVKEVKIINARMCLRKFKQDSKRFEKDKKSKMESPKEKNY